MLDHLGHKDAHDAMLAAIETTLAEPTTRTADLGGSAGTTACGKAVAAAIET